MIFGDKDLEEISSEDILTFLNKITDGRKQQTKRTRYSHLAAFFNFIETNIDERIQNPCANQLLKKLYKTNTPVRWDSFEKETIDEIIFRTTKPRNRLILELMARGGMRIGEVLKLTPDDIAGQKLLLRDPKSGREQEFIFITQKIADRLREYIVGPDCLKEDYCLKNPHSGSQTFYAQNSYISNKLEKNPFLTILPIAFI